MKGWLRIGGVLVAPRRTFEAILREEDASTTPILVLLLVAAIVSAPLLVAQNALLTGVEVTRGLAATLQTVAQVAVVGIAAVAALWVLAAAVLWKTTGRPGAGMLVPLGTAAAYLYVPAFVTVLAGKALATLGLDVGWLPHHPVGGLDVPSAVRVGVQIAWSVTLLPALIRAAGTVAGDDAAVPQSEPAKQQSPVTPSTRARVATVIVAGLSVALLAVAGTEISAAYPSIRPIYPGDTAPGLELLSIGSPRRRVTLADLRGKVVLVDFWATWCPPCVKSMPELQLLHTSLGAEGLEILGVNRDMAASDRAPRVREFIARFGLGFTIVLDTGVAGAAYRVARLPTSYLIDRSGVVRHVHIGAVDAVTLEREVRALLAEAPPVPGVPES